MPGHRPEVAGDQRQHAKRTSAERHEKTRNDKQRATKIKNDSDARAESAWTKAEVFLFDDLAAEIGKLVDPADDVRRNQRRPLLIKSRCSHSSQDSRTLPARANVVCSSRSRLGGCRNSPSHNEQLWAPGAPDGATPDQAYYHTAAGGPVALSRRRLQSSPFERCQPAIPAAIDADAAAFNGDLLPSDIFHFMHHLCCHLELYVRAPTAGIA
jgi:hypothetical protein